MGPRLGLNLCPSFTLRPTHGLLPVSRLLPVPGLSAVSPVPRLETGRPGCRRVPVQPAGYALVSMNKKPETLVWYRSAAARAWYSASGICPEISTISQLTTCKMVNANVGHHDLDDRGGDHQEDPEQHREPVQPPRPHRDPGSGNPRPPG